MLWVRIFRPKIGKLVSQAESEQIFAKRNSRNRTPIGVLFFFLLVPRARNLTHSRERQARHLYIVKTSLSQRTNRANWVRTPASPSRVETSWARLIPVRVRTMFAPSIFYHFTECSHALGIFSLRARRLVRGQAHATVPKFKI